MAIVAVITAAYMRQVFSDRGHAVMTGSTGTQYLRVINGERGCPDVRVVAVLAHIRCRNMRVALANSLYAVVTTDAISGNADVVEIGGQPTGGRMTIVAGIAARNVRRVLASRR